MTNLKTGPELEGRTGTIHAKIGHDIKDLMETMGKTHELDSNTTKPATRTLPGHKLNTMDSETEICKGYGVEGCRAG
jgi:hypothetical protein